MTAGYESERAWSDRFTPEIAVALKYWTGWSFCEAPLDMDIKQNTDMICMDGHGVRVACRVRRHDYFNAYPHDFTIRAAHDNGAPTELGKVLSGWGDLMFYGFADPDGDRLCGASVGCLGAFRAWYDPSKVLAKHNGDGTHFIAFDARTVPNFIKFTTLT